MVEIKTCDTAIPIRNHAIIAQNYLRGEFPLDIITLLPLAYIINLTGDLEQHLQMIKILRVFRGFKIFNIQKIMVFFKEHFKNKM